MIVISLWQIELRFGRKWEVNSMVPQASEHAAKQSAVNARDLSGADEARIRHVERTLDDRLFPVKDIPSRKVVYA